MKTLYCFGTTITGPGPWTLPEVAGSQSARYATGCTNQWGKRRYAAKEGTKQTNTTRWYPTDITVPPLSLIIVKQGSCHDALHRQQGGLDCCCCCWLAFYAIYQYATISFDPPGPGQTLYYTCPETLCCFILVWTGQDYRRSWWWSWGFCLLLVLSPITKVISLLYVGWV